MKRRELLKAPLAAAAVGATEKPAPPASPADAPAFPQAPGLTKEVCRFVVETRLDDVPGEVIELAKKSILDGLGLALAGSVSTLAPILLRYLASLGAGSGKCTVAGTSLKAPARFAALANGCFIHADDFDDTQLSARPDRTYGLLTHPTVPVLPPALALCEANGRSGRELLAAFVVGTEVECKVAEAIAPRHYRDGFHTTGTVGALGSAAACSKLLGLDAQRTARALGLAAAQAGGLRDNFGTMTKPFHAGHAAEAGVVSAELAALGWTAAEDILEARFGFFQAAGGGFSPAALAGQLGRPFTFAAPGVSIKPHPSGSLTHPAMGAMLGLIRQHDLKPGDVQRVEVAANSGVVTTLLHHQPQTGLQAKFSLEFAMAVLLLERAADLRHYTDAYVQRPEVQALMARVQTRVDDDAERAGLDKMTSVVRVALAGGRTLTARATFARGSPAQPMSFAEVADKLRGCAAFARWPSQRTEALIEAARTLEAAPDVSALCRALGS